MITSTSNFKAFGIGFLGILMALNPLTCRAEMEINPDHYDTGDVSASPTKAKIKDNSNHPVPQKPSTGKLRSRRVSPKRQPVQLSAKTASADHS